MAALLEPGFLDFDNLPDTNFTCVGKVIGGYYADLETSCQMFHVCTIGQLDEPMDIRFLCLNGTVFDQETRVCERIDEVDCAKSEQFYSLNLELYGNTQAPILSEDSDEMVGSSGQSTTTSSRASPTSSEAKVTRQNFIITTAKPTKTTELYKPQTTQRPSTTSRYQIPLNRPPDIRFNPKEINVSLNVRGTANSEPYHQHHYQSTASSTNRFVEEHFTKKPPKFIRNNQLSLIKPTTQRTTTENIHLFINNHQTETEESFVDYQKVAPINRSNYQYRYNVPSFRPSATSGFLRHHQQINKFSHTNRPSPFYSPPKNQHHHSNLRTQQRLLQSSQPYYRHQQQQDYQSHRTESSPVKIQLDVPILPTRQPLTFSSPAPFRLTAQSKHQTPRIVISASASVSDASGRKFNYSLGTIGDSQLFGHAPPSYDDYREEDVGFDPFYHDVLKLRAADRRGGRQKRDLNTQSSTDAIDTLRFLFEWYNRHKSGDADINAMWITENGQNDTTEDVIYKSVIDTIKQDEDVARRADNEDADYIQLDQYELRKSQPFSKNMLVKADNSSLPWQNLTAQEVVKNDQEVPVTRYNQVLNILGITTSAVNEEDLSSTVIELATEEPVEEVLDVPTTNVHQEADQIVDSSLFATTTILSTSQSYTTDTTELVSTEEGSTIFEAKYTTTDFYDEQGLAATLDLQTATTEIPTTYSNLQTFPDITDATVQTAAEIPLSSTVKTTERSLFRSLNHRFNRFRANKPQTYSNDIKSTTRNRYLQQPTTTTASPQLTSPKYVSQISYSQENVTNEITKKELLLKHYIFNCFGKDLNQFYSDPRDCRLFHYCTHGFTNTQLLDMKFVCDLGTFFDSDKLVCTKNRPSRCI